MCKARVALRTKRFFFRDDERKDSTTKNGDTHTHKEIWCNPKREKKVFFSFCFSLFSLSLSLAGHIFFFSLSSRFCENDDDDNNSSKSDDDDEDDDDDDDDDARTSSSPVCLSPKKRRFLWRRWNFLPRGGGELFFREGEKDDDDENNALCNGFTGEEKKRRIARAERGDVRRGAAGVSREQERRRTRRSRWSRYARVLFFSFLFSFVTCARVSQGKGGSRKPRFFNLFLR